MKFFLSLNHKIMKTKILNYIGQLRMYSLVDASILLVSVGANKNELIGVLYLQVAFLAYLENQHAHDGRKKIPQWVWVSFAIAGTTFYSHVEVTAFLICSYFYTKKNKGNWGLLSPLFRGLQVFFISASVIGYNNLLPWVALFVIFIRNTLGDFRDAEKDIKEGMKTIPIAIDMKRNLKYGHLIALLVSTCIWWSYTDLSFYWLGCALLIEVATYNLTPR